MAVSSQQILDFLNANPGMSDADIASNMATYGVSPAQMAAATGTSVNEIVSRVAATVPPNQSVLLGDTWVQPNYQITGSGEDQQMGGLESVSVYKTKGGVNDEVAVGTAVQNYSPTGEYQNTTKTQKVDSGLKEIAALAAAYFVPILGAEIAASLGVSTATGTALAQAGFQIAQGTPLDKILENTIKSQVLGSVSSFANNAVTTALANVVDDPFLQKVVNNIGTNITNAIVTGNTDNLGASILGSVVGTSVTEQTGDKALGSAAAILTTTGNFQSAALAYASSTGVSQTKANDVVTQLQNVGLVNNSGAASFADANTADDTDTQISNQINQSLIIDASGAKDVNTAAAFADASGFTQFTFDNKTYTLDTNEEKKIANLEAQVRAETVINNLAGGEYEGIDAQAAAQAKANNIVIGDAEADTLDEAAYLAKLRNPTGTSFTIGGKTYTMGTSSAALNQAVAEDKAAQLQDRINSAPTRNAAYKIAREGLGAGKTFTYNGKEYSTATAEERPDLTGKTTETTATTATADQSAAETNRLLAQNKTLVDASTANQSPAEVARLLAKNADLVAGNVTANQSAAETARLAKLNNTLVLGNAPNESVAETQRLVEAGERSVAQNLNTFALQALGTTARGAASFISNAGETYAQLTGDFNYENAATKLGKEIADYAKSKDVYGLDVQKNRLTQSLAQADNTDNFLEKMSIIGSAIKKNPLGFFDVAGSEFVEEAPETAIQIAAALMSGGVSLSVKGAKIIQGAASLIGSFAETFGSAGKEAYQKSIARGDSVQVARDKSYINASINALAEMVPDFFADKALVAPIMKNFTEKTLKGIGAGYATNAAAGVVSEFFSGTLQNYSTQYVVDPKTASLSKAITNGIFESAIGGTVQTAMATPNTVVDTGAVIGRDYSGNNVTLQQVLDGGSNIDASTVDSSKAIATNADGTSMTVGSAILFAQENNAGLDVIGSFLPSNLTGVDVVVATDTAITAESAQQVMADLGLNVTDDVAISLATKIASNNNINEVTLGNLITDMTGKPANLTGKSNTSTVISLDTGAGTAVVMDSKGNTNVVSVAGDVKVGSVVTVNANTNTATTTGKTVDTAANTATVVSVDTASGTAIVADSKGSSSVVNVSGDVQVGSTVTVNAATGTATATNAATATAANAATNTAVTAAASTAADTAVNSAVTAATAADTATNATTNATTATDVATNAATAANAATATSVAANAATTAATASNAATTAATNAATATDVATNAAAATNSTTAANAATAATAATNAATSTATNAAVAADVAVATSPAVSTATAVNSAVNTSVVVSVDKLDDTVLVRKPDGTFDVIANPGNLTVGDVIGQPAVVETPAETPVATTPAETPVATTPVETPVATTPVKTPTAKTPTTKTPATPTTPTGGGGGGAADATPPPLANVFYYGKEFGTQKQQVGPGGRLQQTPYQALSVSRPGAEAPVAQQARTEENDTEAMLQKILSQKEDDVSIDELMRMLG